MKGKACFFVLAVFLTVAVIISTADAQLLKRVITSKGGGGSDIVELMSFIPNEAELILSVNWENLSKTELLGLLKQQLGEDFQIIEAMGIDIENDIKHVIFGMTFEEEPTLYGVLAGSFDEDKIVKLFKEEGAEFEAKKWGRFKVYVLDEVAFAFAKEGILFGGSEAREAEGVLKQMLKAGKNSLANDKRMVDLIKDTNTGATVWGALIVPDELREEIASEAGDELPFDTDSLRMMNISVDYGRSIVAKAGVYFARSSDASKFAEFSKQMLDEADEEEDIPEQVLKMMQRIDIGSDGKTATFALKASSDEVKQLVQTLSGETEQWDDDDSWDDDDDDDDDDGDDDDWDDDDDDDDDWDDDGDDDGDDDDDDGDDDDDDDEWDDDDDDGDDEDDNDWDDDDDDEGDEW